MKLSTISHTASCPSGSRTITKADARKVETHVYARSMAGQRVAVTVAGFRGTFICELDRQLFIHRRRMSSPGVVRERLGLHASADSDLAEIVEELDADPGCYIFFLSDGRDPVDLPSTWAEARVSADTFGREQFGMLGIWCIGRHRKFSLSPCWTMRAWTSPAAV